MGKVQNIKILEAIEREVRRRRSRYILRIGIQKHDIRPGNRYSCVVYVYSIDQEQILLTEYFREESLYKCVSNVLIFLIYKDICWKK